MYKLRVETYNFSGVHLTTAWSVSLRPRPCSANDAIATSADLVLARGLVKLMLSGRILGMTAERYGGSRVNVVG